MNTFFTRIINTLFRKKHAPLFSRQPEKDWLKILGFFIVFLILVLALDGWIFYKIGQKEIFLPGPAAADAQALAKSALQETAAFYAAREKQLSALKLAPFKI